MVTRPHDCAVIRAVAALGIQRPEPVSAPLAPAAVIENQAHLIGELGRDDHQRIYFGKSIEYWLLWISPGICGTYAVAPL